MLNRVERIKINRKEALNDHQKAASEPLNLMDSHSCSGHQNLAANPPHKRQVSFSKGVIQLGPTGNCKVRTKVRNPPLRKESDHQKSANNWVTESGNNLKIKLLWVQRFFKNPNKRPFKWSFKTCCEEEGDGRKEILEERIDMREDDIDRFHEWHSSENEDTEASEDDFLARNQRKEKETRLK